MRLRILIAGLILAFAGWQLAGAGWIEAKAHLGQALMERAWDKARQGDETAKPWPWADTWPVARLHVPELGIAQLVLSGDDGAALAWGPGLVQGVAHTVISAHRDTHFRFLKDLQPGQRLVLEQADGIRTVWQMASAQVVDSRQVALDLDAPDPLLTLVTCFPFDAAAAGGPLRYVVTLRPAPKEILIEETI